MINLRTGPFFCRTLRGWLWVGLSGKDSWKWRSMQCKKGDTRFFSAQDPARPFAIWISQWSKYSVRANATNSSKHQVFQKRIEFPSKPGFHACPGRWDHRLPNHCIVLVTASNGSWNDLVQKDAPPKSWDELDMYMMYCTHVCSPQKMIHPADSTSSLGSESTSWVGVYTGDLVRHVHLGCLRHWIRGRLNLSDRPLGSYFYRRSRDPAEHLRNPTVLGQLGWSFALSTWLVTMVVSHLQMV